MKTDVETRRHPLGDTAPDLDEEPRLVVVWPITGPSRNVVPRGDERLGLAMAAADDFKHVADACGVMPTDPPLIEFINTDDDMLARAHPQAHGCYFSIRATAPTRRKP